VTIDLDELKSDPDHYRDKCVRIRLKEGELMDCEVDCLQLQVEAPPPNVDLSVDYGAAFNMKALAERVSRRGRRAARDLGSVHREDKLKAVETICPYKGEARRPSAVGDPEREQEDEECGEHTVGVHAVHSGAVVGVGRRRGFPVSGIASRWPWRVGGSQSAESRTAAGRP
jgi:hypothetical protein